MDSIIIKDLEIFAHHGVRSEENTLGQKFLVSLTMFMDIGPAGVSDDLKKSVDYADISHFVDRKMKERNFRLIEAAAEYLAGELLVNYPLIREVIVEIKKPWAPVLLPLDTVSVRIRRKWCEAYLGVGSNQGDREGFLRAAFAALEEDPMIRDMRMSKIIETKPYGVEDQPDFLNAAIGFRTLYSPEELLDRLHEIENRNGRERKERWGPRTLDLDILLYEDRVLQTEDLRIPHVELHLREFVLGPLSEIAPWKIHPVLGKSILQLYEEKIKETDQYK
ncbi:MAG: 2-amino-4-hydroxy-6-hydroxymethyldihydropteridine diphosphokinase [Eubacterium sp.]|nr:2-amino-4-hydroxy-6-hydroxymethyldihydropteridine diphosphokinase [Eubacterium sp.]